MGRSMSDSLSFATHLTHKSVESGVVLTVEDIDRILALPTRPPIDCEIDPRTGKYPPRTQALIEVITEKFTRGPRLSCACRERRVTMLADGRLAIGRTQPAELPPEAPIIATVADFVADAHAPAGGGARHLTVADSRNVGKVQAMKPGESVMLPAADAHGHACITNLNAVQSWFLYEAEQQGGAVGFCGVGSGKSFALILAALLFPDSKLAALLIEPKQRLHYRSQYLRLREHFRVPSMVPDSGEGYTVPGTVPVHLISYSMLQQRKNSDMLDTRSPDVLLGDEFHRACGKSAINSRVKRYLADKILEREQMIARGEPVRARAVRLLAGSGTMESGSVEDTHMVCTFALGTGSPIPLDPHESQRWSQVIDDKYQPDRRSKTAKMLFRVFANTEIDSDDLNNLFDTTPTKKLRDGFCQRRLQTPGIISASASTINAAIYISERKAPKMPPAVREALMKVRTEGLRPDGEVLVGEDDDGSGALRQITCARNVACGFYQYWAFPNHPCACTPDALRCTQCLLIDDWYAKRKAFNKELRVKLIQGEMHLDSKALCEEAAERFYADPPYVGKLPVWDCKTWPAWRDIEDQVQHVEKERWIENGGDFLIKDAAKFALDEKFKSVIWFQSRAFGRALSELTGLPYYNGGPGAEERIRAEKGDRSIICSIKAHGAGTDGLQNIFNHQLIAETPASNSKQTGYEQLLGRLHRQGQTKDAVHTFVYVHVSELMDGLRRAKAQAEFNFVMQRNKQKMLMADIDIEGF